MSSHGSGKGVEFRSRPTLRKRSRFITSSKAWLAVSPPQSKPRSCLDPPQFPAGTVEKFLAVVQPRRAHSQERVLVQVLSACRTVFLCPKLQKRSVGPVLLRVPLTAVESSAAKPLSRGWRRFSAMEDRQVPPPLPLPSPHARTRSQIHTRHGLARPPCWPLCTNSTWRCHCRLKSYLHCSGLHLENAALQGVDQGPQDRPRKADMEPRGAARSLHPLGTRKCVVHARCRVTCAAEVELSEGIAHGGQSFRWYYQRYYQRGAFVCAG
jgi:hypothetical protein